MKIFIHLVMKQAQNIIFLLISILLFAGCNQYVEIPHAEIIFPDDGISLNGSEVYFVSDKYVTWISDKDGYLGSGETLDASLSLGNHKVSIYIDDYLLDSITIEIKKRDNYIYELFGDQQTIKLSNDRDYIGIFSVKNEVITVELSNYKVNKVNKFNIIDQLFMYNFYTPSVKNIIISGTSSRGLNNNEFYIVDFNNINGLTGNKIETKLYIKEEKYEVLIDVNDINNLGNFDSILSKLDNVLIEHNIILYGEHIMMLMKMED